MFLICEKKEGYDTVWCISMETVNIHLEHRFVNDFRGNYHKM